MEKYKALYKALKKYAELCDYDIVTEKSSEEGIIYIIIDNTDLGNKQIFEFSTASGQLDSMYWY